MEKLHTILLCLIIGGGIGLFPLVTGSVGVPPTRVVEAMDSPSFPSQFKIHVDERKLDWAGKQSNEEILMVNGRAYLPVRVFEELGGEVRWDGVNREIEVKLD